MTFLLGKKPRLSTETLAGKAVLDEENPHKQ